MKDVLSIDVMPIHVNETPELCNLITPSSRQSIEIQV
jgi:hypothetical protein